MGRTGRYWEVGVFDGAVRTGVREMEGGFLNFCVWVE
jgi:hypothetical protein